MPRLPVPSHNAIAQLKDQLLNLKYGLGVPTNNITPEWTVPQIRALLNVVDADPTGRLAAQIKQAIKQGVI